MARKAVWASFQGSCSLYFSKAMAKLVNIVGEHVKFDMFANNVAQCGRYVGQQIQVGKCSRHVCICSKQFREHLLFDGMLSNLATMFDLI